MATKTMTAERCAFIYGQPMKPCPKCNGYNLKYQTPIKMDEPLPEPFDARKLLGIWARARRAGKTPLLGTTYLMCFDCRHKGPALDVAGRTAEDVGRDPAVAREVKRLWNEQQPNAAGQGREAYPAPACSAVPMTGERP